MKRRPAVFWQPAAFLRVLVGENAGHVDVAPGESLIITNQNGRARVTLQSGTTKHLVLEAEVTRLQWLALQIAQTERAPELDVTPPKAPRPRSRRASGPSGGRTPRRGPPAAGSP